jgi:hypothetical protein
VAAAPGYRSQNWGERIYLSRAQQHIICPFTKLVFRELEVSILFVKIGHALERACAQNRYIIVNSKNAAVNRWLFCSAVSDVSVEVNVS